MATPHLSSYHHVHSLHIILSVILSPESSVSGIIPICHTSAYDDPRIDTSAYYGLLQGVLVHIKFSSACYIEEFSGMASNYWGHSIPSSKLKLSKDD